MPKNKNFLLRIQKLNALFNTGKRYTIDELIDLISIYLYDKTGINNGVSERTIRNDIKHMRENFGAPIEVENGRYFYASSDYSIFNTLQEQDVEVILEAYDLLENNLPLPFVKWLGKIYNKTANAIGFTDKHLYLPYISLEINKNYSGLKWIKTIYESIQTNNKLFIDYNSFNGEGDFEEVVRPYILKEYQNRWFLIGKVEKTEEMFFTIPLDRIYSVKKLDKYFNPMEKYRVLKMFDEIIGVTYIEKNPLEEIELEFNPTVAGYIKTKPIHFSQRILRDDDRFVIGIKVRVNYELLQVILSYIPNIKIHKPKYLREKINDMLIKGIDFINNM
jgi:predicted DNA-binding transcriptional regulator YafY